MVFFTSDSRYACRQFTPEGCQGHAHRERCVPLIAWPGTVPAGTTTDRNIHCLDFYPTCLDLAGRQWEPSTDDHPLDGESFATVLLNPNSQSPRGPIFYLFPGYMDSRAQPTVVAIDRVNGKTYKLLYYYESYSWELYCLKDDPGETKYLVQTLPKVTATLSQTVNQWLEEKSPTGARISH